MTLESYRLLLSCYLLSYTIAKHKFSELLNFVNKLFQLGLLRPVTIFYYIEASITDMLHVQ